MRWSKLKKIVESRFSASLQGRLCLYSTHYSCSCGRGWITLDGKQLVDFSTLASGNRYRAVYHETTVTDCATHPAVAPEDRTPGKLTEYGEFSRFDLHEACWQFAHSSLADSLASTNPLVVGLAVLDARVGRQRLERMAAMDLHPLTRELLGIRLAADPAYRTSMPSKRKE